VPSGEYGRLISAHTNILSGTKITHGRTSEIGIDFAFSGVGDLRDVGLKFPCVFDFASKSAHFILAADLI